MKFGIILQSHDEKALNMALETAQQNHCTVVIFCPHYDTRIESTIENYQIMSPMDYLNSGDIDSIYKETFEWHSKLLSLKLDKNTSLEEFLKFPGVASPVWSWPVSSFLLVFVAIRLIETLRSFILAEKIESFTVIGEHPTLAWHDEVLKDVLTTYCSYLNETNKNNSQMAIDNVFNTHSNTDDLVAVADYQKKNEFSEDLSKARNDIEVKKHKELAKQELDNLRQLGLDYTSGGFAGQVVCIVHGGGDQVWSYSHKYKRMLWVDQYIELVPEALVEFCEKNNWLLTIVYQRGKLGQDNDPAIYKGERISYADKFPKFVREIYISDFPKTMTGWKKWYEARTLPRLEYVYSHPSFRRCLRYKGLDLGHVLNKVFEKMFKSTSVILSQTDGWSDLLAEIRADVLFSSRLNIFPHLCKAAHRANCRVITSALGIGNEMLLSMTAKRHDGSFPNEIYPDEILTWGDEQAEFLSRKVPAYTGKLNSFGRSRNDSFVAAEKEVNPDEIKLKLGVPVTEHVVIFGCNCRTRIGQDDVARYSGICLMPPEQFYDYLSALNDIDDEIGTVHVFVKPHPSDDLEMIEEMLNEIGNEHFHLCYPNLAGDYSRLERDKVGENLHNYELLAAASLFIGNLTSMFSESLIMNTPNVNIWTKELNYYFEHDRMDTYKDIANTVLNSESYKTELIKLLTDKQYHASSLAKQKSMLTPIFGMTKGDNAERIVEHCLGGTI